MDSGVGAVGDRGSSRFYGVTVVLARLYLVRRFLLACRVGDLWISQCIHTS